MKLVYGLFTHRISIRSFARLSVAFLASGILTGCSTQTAVTNVRLTLPNWNEERTVAAYTQSKVQALTLPAGQSARTQMTRLMINVTGPGVGTKQVLIWEANDVLGAAPAATDLEFEIQSNTTALFQVMAITRDFVVEDATGAVISNGDDDIFYYGDVDHQVTAGSQDVGLTVRALSFGTAREGRIAGRYLPAAGAALGPTGKVFMKYHPPARPNHPMILMETEIFSGWFNFFSLEGAGFTYWLADGTELFPNSRAQTDKLPAISSNAYQIRAQLPEGWYDYGSGSNRNHQKAKFLIAGFFGAGAGASNHRVCVNPGPYDFQNFYNASTGGSYIQWIGNAPPTANQGGVTVAGDRSLNCGSTPYVNAFDDYFFLAEMQWVRDGSAVEFKAPFRYVNGDTDHRLLQVGRNGLNLELKWQMLPGTVGADRVDSISFFTRALLERPSDDGERDFKIDDGIRCDQLTSLGFTERQRVVLNDDVGVKMTTIGPIDPVAYAEGRLDVIACAHGPNGFYRSGLSFRKQMYSQPATHLGLSLAGNAFFTDSSSPASIIPGVCTPLFITPRTFEGDLGFYDQSINLNLASNDTGVNFYSDATCATHLGAGSISIPNFHNNNTIYSIVTAATGTYNFTVQAAYGELNPTNLYYARLTPTHPSMLRTYSPNLNRKYVCIPVQYQLTNTAGFAVSAVSGSVTLTLPSLTNLTFFEDGSCETGAPTNYTFAVASAQSTRALYYRYTGHLNLIDLAPTVTGVAPALASPVQILSPGAATRISISIASSFTKSTCQRVEISLTDSSWYRTPAIGAPVGVALSTSQPTSGKFYPDMTTCTNQTGDVTSTAIPIGLTSSFVYYRHENTDVIGLTAAPAVAGSPLLPTSLTNINVMN